MIKNDSENPMKRFFAFLLAILSSIALISCTSYSDTVDTDRLADVGLHALSDSVEYIELDGDYLSDYFAMPEWVTDEELRMAKTASNLNQIGIFHVREGHADEMKELLSAYLTQSYADNKAWYDSYIPKETSKLRDAEVRIYGNYAVYAILSANDRALFFNAIEEELKQ